MCNLTAKLYIQEILTILVKTKRLPVGCSQIDDMLGGGIEYGIITEVYGEGGSGKTNFCLMVALSAAKRGERIVYVDTEGVSPERIFQIFKGNEHLVENIYFMKPKSLNEQYEHIIEIMKKMDEMGFLVIIIDSLTQFYRLERGMEEDVDERGILSAMLGTLLYIAREKNACILVTNQVYSDREGEIKPIGGHVLYHGAKTIIKLKRLNGNWREAILIKHRSLPEDKRVKFRITERGIE